MAETEINIEDKVKSFALDLGIEYNNLKPKTKQHLMNIERSIFNRESKYLELKDELQKNKITLTSISEDAGISSRQTIYNNPELKVYANTRMHIANELNPYHLIDELNVKMNELKERLDKMVERDIDTEVLRYMNKQLQKDISNREDVIARMQDQSSQMKTEISKLKKSAFASNSKTTTSKSTILTFSKDK